MRSTMQEAPLSIATIVRYATTVHSEVRGRDLDGRRASAAATTARSAAAPRNWPTGCGRSAITGDQRVGTFMWNNAEHLEAYAAVPGMGAVLHTLNIRLFPEQLIYTANHAEDEVVIVDAHARPAAGEAAARR